MTLKDVRLVNFRSYPALSMDLHPGINLFVGANAAGKTNLCEGVYMLMQGHSFRTRKIREVISFGKSQAYLSANMEWPDSYDFVELKIDLYDKKTLRLNGEVVEGQRQYRAQNPVVLFTPDALDLIKGSPGGRRQFLDEIALAVNPLYAKHKEGYDHILRQRNNRLRQGVSPSDKLLEVYDEQLIQFGVPMLKWRQELVDRLNPLIHEEHIGLSRKQEKLQLSYVSFLRPKGNRVEQEYREALRFHREEDIRYQMTTVGPHRDDMDFILNDRDAKVYGSQGQQRSAVLSLKLAQLEILRKGHGRKPLLILDDVFSELDQSRKERLILALEDIQSLITTTDESFLREVNHLDYRCYHIGETNITRLPGREGGHYGKKSKGL